MSVTELPPPPPALLAHSHRLLRHICDEIDQVGAISFYRYMQLALYAPGLGYYSAGTKKLGATGDFITAPELSPLFGQCIARQCEQVGEWINDYSILECGAGSGALALEILQTLQRQQQLPAHYFILEVSADLRQRQPTIVRAACP